VLYENSSAELYENSSAELKSETCVAISNGKIFVNAKATVKKKNTVKADEE
jgi:hypothetical protein